MRLPGVIVNVVIVRFQSTHPLRDATEIQVNVPLIPIFQSTHPLRDATSDVYQAIHEIQKFQSTHPLRDATLHPQTDESVR